ncbi:iron hydrogenase [Mortierella sp. GBAus27b]|nr:iron hydrogenase [Mortierella sp. GBAus27b]
MALSGALTLSDLNDFISPSQACIKPVEVAKTSDTQGSIRVDNTGSYYEVSQDGLETRLETATISLNDCLACSGCITSAESVLVTLQSQEELYSILNQNKIAIETNDPGKHRTVVISISPQTRASFAAKYNQTPLQVARKLTWFFKNLGVHSVFDTSFSRDLSLLETGREFVARYKKAVEKGIIKPPTANGSAPSSKGEGDMEVDGQQEVKASKAPKKRIIRRGAAGASDEPAVAAEAESAMPMLASACPGWICYAEKTHGYILPYISEIKSPQQIMGSLVKNHFGSQLGLNPNQVYHVCVMPCYDKKLEASRSDFYSDLYSTRDVDCVITSTEVEKMFAEQGHSDMNGFGELNLDLGYNSVVKDPTTGADQVLVGASGNASGGFLEYLMQYAARELFGIDGVDVDKGLGVEVKTVRNADFREVTLEMPGASEPLLKFAAAYGFRNIQNLVRKVKTGKSPYHFVEVMACPSGCINGGGQLKPLGDNYATVPLKDWIAQTDQQYRNGVLTRKPEENPVLEQLYLEWLGGLDTLKAKQQLRTGYHAVEQNLINPLAVKW